MAKGMMSRPPTGGGLKERSARQELRKQYLERRGREYKGGGRVSAMPVSEESDEMTARQQRRQQFLERKQARQDRRVEDWRAQQQAANVGNAVGQLPTDLAGQLGGQMADFANKPGSQGENPFGDYRQLTDQELYERGYNPRDYNSVSIGPDGQIISTMAGYDNSPISPEEKERLWQERLRNPRPQFNSGFEYNRALEQNPGSFGLSAGSLAGAFGAPMPQEPMRTPTPAYVNAMPGQLKTGTFTPQGMYRPLPWYATPQQIRERQALIQGGHYFNQLLPKQRMG
jgi:hypothetical protein